MRVAALAFPRRVIAVAGTLLALLAAAAAAQPAADDAALPSPAAEHAVQRLRPQVIAAYPHDAQAFTQGLVLHDGKLYESTGLHGRSSLRCAKFPSGEACGRVDLAPHLFGEGLAVDGNRLVQLTWQQNVALVYEREGLVRAGELKYQGEGWGLCHDGERFVMTDGSHRLFFRDPRSFQVMSQVEVKLDGARLMHLNELECVGGAVYANVWPTDRIVRIEKHSGRVLAVVDGAALLSASERAELAPGAVLNGIAYDASDDTFLFTGKLWPKLFRVKLVSE
jgi:glutaminyl-peptide cyclotransferase